MCLWRQQQVIVYHLQVSGIEGSFRTTCENVMRVQRDNKESMMAVLEAFVYDPLINWRLLGTATASPKTGMWQSVVHISYHDIFSYFQVRPWSRARVLRRSEGVKNMTTMTMARSSQPE